MATLLHSICPLLFCATLLSLISCHANGLPENRTPLVIFGDSLFDAGNNNYLNISPDAQSNYWPYGETFFKYPTGRFSDGRIVPDFIAEYAKLPFIPPYLQPGSHKFLGGVNFASAGAGALSQTRQVLALQTQVSYFKKIDQQWRHMIGDEKGKKLISKAVYIFSFGSNDYFVFTRNSSLPKSFNREEFVGMVIGNISVAIKEIHKVGGRKFGFLNLGELGCVPASKALEPGSTGACNEEANALAKLHNKALSGLLQELETQLEGFKYSIHDLYTSTHKRIKNPKKYGFKVGNEACCGSGPFRGRPSCGVKKTIKGFKLCENPNEYLFFDSAHPTDKAAQQISELMWNGNSNITWPYNLKALFEA